DVEPRKLKGRHRRALPAQIAIKRRGERRALDRRLDTRRQRRLSRKRRGVLSSRRREGNKNADAKAPRRNDANRPARTRFRTHAQYPTWTPRFGSVAFFRSGNEATRAVGLWLSLIRLAGPLHADPRRRLVMAQGSLIRR